MSHADKQTWFEIMEREARIAENQRIFAQRVAERQKQLEADLQAAMQRQQQETAEKKLRAKQRQAANRAARAAENRRIRDLRNRNSK